MIGDLPSRGFSFADDKLPGQEQVRLRAATVTIGHPGCAFAFLATAHHGRVCDYVTDDPFRSGHCRFQARKGFAMQNIGRIDRTLRVVLGLGLLAAAPFVPRPWQWIAAAGAVLVLTAIVRFCPAYWLLRIRTLARPTVVRSD